jgi:hypothetical protein
MGVGIPDYIGLPVNYIDSDGQFFTVWVTGLLAEDVRAEDGATVESELAQHAIDTLNSIVTDDAEYKQSVIRNHKDNQACILRYENQMRLYEDELKDLRRKVAGAATSASA